MSGIAVGAVLNGFLNHRSHDDSNPVVATAASVVSSATPSSIPSAIPSSVTDPKDVIDEGAVKVTSGEKVTHAENDVWVNLDQDSLNQLDGTIWVAASVGDIYSDDGKKFKTAGARVKFYKGKSEITPWNVHFQAHSFDKVDSSKVYHHGCGFYEEIHDNEWRVAYCKGESFEDNSKSKPFRMYLSMKSGEKEVSGLASGSDPMIRLIIKDQLSNRLFDYDLVRKTPAREWSSPSPSASGQ